MRLASFNVYINADFDFIGLGWGFIVCISDEFPGGADTPGHEPSMAVDCTGIASQSNKKKH